MCINVVGSEGGDKKPREWADVNNGSGVSSKLWRRQTTLPTTVFSPTAIQFIINCALKNILSLHSLSARIFPAVLSAVCADADWTSQSDPSLGLKCKYSADTIHLKFIIAWCVSKSVLKSSWHDHQSKISQMMTNLITEMHCRYTRWQYNKCPRSWSRAGRGVSEISEHLHTQPLASYPPCLGLRPPHPGFRAQTADGRMARTPRNVRSPYPVLRYFAWIFLASPSFFHSLLLKNLGMYNPTIVSKWLVCLTVFGWFTFDISTFIAVMFADQKLMIGLGIHWMMQKEILQYSPPPLS